MFLVLLLLCCAVLCCAVLCCVLLCGRSQLDAFVKQNPTARPVNAECTVYEVPINTIYGRLSLYVQFPPAFPSAPPVIQVTSLVQHPWVDAEMYMAHHPKIVHWSASSNAGQLVSEIVQEWSKTPPPPRTASAAGGEAKGDKDGDWVVVNRASAGGSPMSASPASSGAAAAPTSSTSSTGSSAQSKAASLTSPSSSSSAASSAFSLSLPIPTTFPFLSSLTLSELQHLDSHPQLLTDHLLSLPSSVQLQHIKADMYSTLTQQTAQSLALQTSYQAGLEHVRRLRRELEDERRSLDEAMRRQDAVVGRWSVGGLLQQLERSVDEAERRSEKTRERYMGGRGEEEKVEVRAGAPGGAAAAIGADDDEESKDSAAKRGDVHARFVDAYVKQRALVHERSAKRERLVEQLQQRGLHVQQQQPHG